MFSPPIYISIGDEYDKRGSNAASKSGRAHAPAFVTPAKRKPHLIDSLFGPVNPLSHGDPYHTSATALTQAVAATATLTHTSGMHKDQPVFRPAGRSHKSSTKGDYYGTFSEANPIKHVTELPLVTRGNHNNAAASGNTNHSNANHKSNAVRPMQTRNFYTSPAKKGTYGYTGLTIGKAGEVCYVSDCYDAAAAGDARSSETLQRRAEAQRERSTRPFRSAVRQGGCFDDSEHGFTRVYSLSKPLPARKTCTTHTSASSSARGGNDRGVAAADAAAAATVSGSATTPVGRPWIPAGTLTTEMTKHVEYQEDPYDIKEQKVRQENMKQRQYKAWHPTASNRNRYIYTKPIDFIPPPVV